MIRRLILCLWIGLPGWTASGASVPNDEGPRMIQDRPRPLRSGDKPEWDTDADVLAPAGRLDRSFQARSNGSPATLFIRQDDVRQDWAVELNGRRLDRLFTMEASLTHTLPVPPGYLHDGSNLLAIIPPRELDYIVVGPIILDPRAPAAAGAEAVVQVQVMPGRAQASHAPGGLPCRITIVEPTGALAAVFVSSNLVQAGRAGRALSGSTPHPLAVRPGVVYTADGRAAIGVRAGTYQVYASRGFEWGVSSQTVAVRAGETQRVELMLHREVDTSGWVSCDTHVHTFTHSRHGDASMEERMLTLAGEGIELPIATDHNLHIDYTDTARAAGVAAHFTSVTGNEVTTPAGHFNIFPARPDARVPDFKLTDWPRLMTAMRGTPDVQVVVLNHPRNVHNGFQPFAATNFNAVTGENLRGPEFTFDAMEVLNSSAQQSDYLLVYRDWFALLNHGYRITAVGSSDSHDVSRYIVGQGRTYLAMPDTDPGRLDVAAACASLRAGRAAVSMGLLPQVTVNERFGPGDVATHLGPQLAIAVRMLGPSWVSVTNVAVFANGAVILERAFAPNTNAGVKAAVDWTWPRPRHDVHLVVLATGPGVTAPFWAIPKPYQPTSPQWTGRVIGSSNPVWVDADGDGRFSPAREYAVRVVRTSGSDPAALLTALGDYDEAVAAQAAGLVRFDDEGPGGAAWQTALRSASEPVRRGFDAYQRAAASARRSESAKPGKTRQ